MAIGGYNLIHPFIFRMYLRFVTTRVDEDSHKPQGVLVASYALLDSGDLTRDEWKHVRGILDWFNENLPHPPETVQNGSGDILV